MLLLQEVARLVQQHFGEDRPFELPLVTKLYVLRKQPATAAAHAHSSGSSSSCSRCGSGGSRSGGGDEESDDEGHSMQALVRRRT
jgi:uncharacterized membrane protein YgcG